jgi:hypothetical protein
MPHTPPGRSFARETGTGVFLNQGISGDPHIVPTDSSALCPVRLLRFGSDVMSRNHVTLRLPLKTPVDANALAELLPRLPPDLFAGADALGAVYSSYFAVQDEETLLFLGDFDGEFAEFVAVLAKAAGPVFDDIFSPVKNSLAS